MRLLAIIIVILSSFLLSCEKPIDEISEIYGLKNTVTYNMPHGTEVFSVDRATDMVGSLAHSYYHSQLQYLIEIHITNYESLHLLRFYTEYPLPIGVKINNKDKFITDDIEIRMPTWYYFNEWHKDDYIIVDEFERGHLIKYSETYSAQNYNEIALLKGRFAITMNTCDSIGCPDSFLITGTFYLSR